MSDRATAHHELVNQLHRRRIALADLRKIGHWSQAQDRDLARVASEKFGDHFVARMLVLANGALKVGPGEPVRAVQVFVIDHRSAVGGRRHADPRVQGRIELLDDRGDVCGRLLRIDRPRRCRDREHMQPGIEQRQTEGHRVVNPWVTINDDLACHETSLKAVLLLHEPDIGTLFQVLPPSPLP